MSRRRSRQRVELTDEIVLENRFELGKAAGDQCSIDNAMVGNQGDQASAIRLQWLIREAGGAKRGVKSVAAAEAGQC